MADKRSPDKIGIAKTPSGKVPAAKKPASKAVDFKSETPIIVKRGPGRKFTSATKSTQSRIPNAVSRKALADLEAGRVTRHADVDELFDHLGIKIGKA